MEEKSLIVGFDLGDKYSQICYFDEDKLEPVCVGKDENEMFIPTVMGLKDTGEWLCGREAIAYYDIGRCRLINDFVNRAADNNPIYIDEKEIMPELLFVTFFRKTLFKLKQYEPGKSIKKIVITIEKLGKNISEYIYLAMEAMGITRDSTVILNHKQSYLYYVLSHNSELWVNDVGMFDFDYSGFKYYQISVDRHRTPYIAGITEKDYSDSLNIAMLHDEKYKDSITGIFENVVQNAIHRQILSALYMIGEGFDSDWADESMKKMCNGRRVFKGRNLYVRGACYAARKLAGLGKMDDFVFIDEDMIASHVSAGVYINAGFQNIILAKAGSVWYEVDNTIDIIPDEEAEIEISVLNIMTREVAKHFIPIDVIDEKRPGRMSRISLRVRFQSVDKCIITIKDNGFGDMVKSSHKISERIINI